MTKSIKIINNKIKRTKTFIVYKNDDYYLGKYSNNKPNGRGFYIYSNGSRYIGNFKNNKYHGKGEFYVEATGDKSIIEHKDGIEIPNKK